MKMIETEIDGLTHRCSNPECHVPAFINTLKLRRGDDGESIIVGSRNVCDWEVGDIE